VELECKYRTKEDGSLYTPNKYPEIVEELYKTRELIVRMPGTAKQESLLDWISVIEGELFSEGGEHFEKWKEMNKYMLEDLLYIFFAETLNGVLTWAIKGRLEKILL
jgi:hypothetical protein